jgi:hypothetical protein
MVRFAEAFPDAEIVAALRRQLGWSHFKALIPIKDPLKREFYAELCRVEGWSTRFLQQKIDGMLNERTALSKKPDALIRKEQRLTPDAASRSHGVVAPETHDRQVRALAFGFDEHDGPMLRHGLQEVAGTRLIVPRVEQDRPRGEFLEERYEMFRKAG